MAGHGGGGGEPTPEKDTVREARAQPAAPLALIVTDGATAATYPLVANGRLLIGRSRATCDVVVASDSMSREHAVLRLDDGVTVEDLGSSNGTTVGGRRAKPRVPTRVELGQVITMGSVRLVVAAMLAEMEVGPDQSARDEEVAAEAMVPVLAHGDVVVRDPAMRELYRMVDRIAPSEISVLVLGETGAGKDVVVSSIHERSGRRGKPFVRINCAALSETLLESELFGHEAGAFTGARGAKPGLLETAQGGTAFLDEVGELPPGVQAKLLHVLESRQVVRLGGVNPRPLDVRFVAATNRELEREVERGAFRRDLFFRLNGATLTVPPLRERPGEIELLARLFARGACAQLGRSKEVSFSPDALAALRAHSWPGNAREVKNVVHRAVLLCQDDRIGRQDLSLTPSPADAPPPPPSAPPKAARAQTPPPPPVTERERIIAALDACAGNQSRAAERLRIPRRTLVKRLVAYDIPRPRKDVSGRRNVDDRETPL